MVTSQELGAFSMYSGIGGAVASVFGSYFGAKSQKASLKAQAAIAESNARIAELGAQSELLRGDAEVGQLTLRAGQIKSAQRTAMSANGVDLGVGNAAEVQASTEIMKEIDKNTITANAVRSAWGYRTQATNFQNEAIVKRGTASGISPIGSAGSTLLGSATNVASNWYGLNKVGALKGTMFEMKD